MLVDVRNEKKNILKAAVVPVPEMLPNHVVPRGCTERTKNISVRDCVFDKQMFIPVIHMTDQCLTVLSSPPHLDCDDSAFLSRSCRNEHRICT